MNVALSCSATFFSVKFVIMAAKIITAPRAVAEAAATAAGLADIKEGKVSELFNAYIYVLNIIFLKLYVSKRSISKFKLINLKFDHT